MGTGIGTRFSSPSLAVSRGKTAGFCWLLFSCTDTLWWCLHPVVALTAATVNSYKSAIQPVEYGTCCSALWVTKCHLLIGKDQCGEEEILAISCPWQCLRIISESCFPPCWEVFICAYNMHSGIQQQRALSTELTGQVTR